MRRLLQVFIALFTICLSWTGAQAQTPLSGAYTINPHQTGDRIFNTFNDAVIALVAYGVSSPVIFNVAANSGPYNEQITITAIKGTSIVNTVTFNGNGNVLETVSTNALNRAVVKLDGAHHIVFDNFTVNTHVTSDAEYGTAFHLIRDADSNIIRKCTINSVMDAAVSYVQNSYSICIDGDDEHGAGTSNCDDNLITQNTITGGYQGVRVYNAAANAEEAAHCKGNQITYNTIINPYNEGVEVDGAMGTIIEGNEITMSSIQYFITAVGVNTWSYATRVFKNRIHKIINVGSGDAYLNTFSVNQSIAEAGLENQIYNNLVYDIGDRIYPTGVSIGIGTVFLSVYHNTFVFNTVNTSYGVNADYSSPILGSAGLVIKNNIFAINAGPSSAYGVLLSVNIPGTLIDHNDYFLQSTGTNKIVYGSLAGTKYYTLPTWQVASKYDYLTVASDPAFENLAGGVLKPTAKELDNRGMAAGIAKDFADVARSTSSPDIGAYEFSSNPCTAPVVTGTVVLVPGNVICEGTPASFDLSGNSMGDGQTYQWASSATETGTYTNMGSALKNAGYDLETTTTMYVKALVTCGSESKYSDPVLLTVNPRVKPGHYTINALQPTGNGNFASFNDAIKSMECGIAGPVVFDVVQGSGPYNESVIIPAIKGASAVNTVTFNGNGEVLSFATTSSIRSTVALHNTSHITLYNLNIVATGTSYAAAVHIRNNSDSNTVRKCKLTVNVTSGSLNFVGLVISGVTTTWSVSSLSYCDYNLIDSNLVIGGYRGIASVGNSDYPVAGNVFSNNTVQDFGESGIYVTSNSNFRIFNNDISRPTLATFSTTNGIYTNFIKSGVIDNNKVHNLADGKPTATTDLVGINVTGGDPEETDYNAVINNLIYNFNSAGKHQGLVNSGVNYTRYYHNTVAMEDVSKSVNKESEAFILSSSATGIEVKNNLFTLRRKLSGTTLSYVVSIASGSTMIMNNNDYVFDASNSYIKTGKFGSTQYVTLANWQSGTSLDAQSVAIDPVYTNMATDNFIPTATALGNKGEGVGVVRDLPGTRRNTSTPDVGAYEFSCSYPAKAAAVKDSIAVCNGSTATFDVKDATSGVRYQWYDQAFYPYFTEGTQLQTGNSFTTPAITSDSVVYYLEAIAANGCGTADRVRVKAISLQPLKTAPIVKTDAVTGESARFVWDEVPGAKGYLVSRNYVDFTIPSTGSAGTSHTVTGLKGGDTLSLIVKATADLECQATVSDSAFARTFTANFFVPNMFTPNGDGKNDELRVYGNTITSLKLMIFNQWGEKVFETADKNQGWNGTNNGKPLSVGVYIYALQMTFSDGTVKSSKGTISLIR